MLANIIAAVKNTVVSWAHNVGTAVKRFVLPSRAVVTATTGVVRDATRNRRELLAENAFSPTRCCVGTGTSSSQQLREATPWGKGATYLICDNDGTYGPKFVAVAEGAEIDVVTIPPKSPNSNPICERLLRSVRHECRDHLIILDEQHLRRAIKQYVSYFNASRPHQGIAQRIPGEGDRDRPFSSGGRVVATPILGGLHHDYRRAA